MILFFFLLLMLAMAWGVADHFQAMVKQPPPAPPPVKVEAPANAQPVVMPPAMQGDSGQPSPPDKPPVND